MPWEVQMSPVVGDSSDRSVPRLKIENRGTRVAAEITFLSDQHLCSDMLINRNDFIESHILSPLREQVETSLRAEQQGTLRKLNKLRGTRADLQSRLRLAQAKTKELEARRTQLEIEEPDGWTAQIVELDKQMVAQTATITQLDSELAVVAGPIRKLEQQLRTAFEDAVECHAPLVRRTIQELRQGVLAKLCREADESLKTLALIEFALKVQDIAEDDRAFVHKLRPLLNQLRADEGEQPDAGTTERAATAADADDELDAPAGEQTIEPSELKARLAARQRR